MSSKDSYNIEVDVTKRDLESTKLQPNETFSEYITRWRKRASQMTTRPLERGQLEMIVKNLLPEYQKHMYAQYLPDFKALIEIGYRMEDGIQSGVFQDKSSNTSNRYRKLQELQCSDFTNQG